VSPLLCSFNDYDSLVDVTQRVIEKPVNPFFIEIQDGEYL